MNNVRCAEMYIQATDFLEKLSYIQNPIGWFLKKNIDAKWEKRVDDWTSYNNYFGIGINAYSQLKDIYYANNSSTNEYKNNLNGNKLPIESFRYKSEIEQLIQVMIRGFRSNLAIRYEFLERLNYVNLEVWEKFVCLFNRTFFENIFDKGKEQFDLKREYRFMMHWIVYEMCDICIAASNEIQ